MLHEIGVYQIVCKTTGKRYIGSTIDSFKKRYACHISRLNNGKHHCKHLQNAWDLYGKDDFLFLILDILDKDDCLKYEQMYFDTMDKVDLFNKCLVANGGHGEYLRGKKQNRRTKAEIDLEPVKEKKERKEKIIKQKREKVVKVKEDFVIIKLRNKGLKKKQANKIKKKKVQQVKEKVIRPIKEKVVKEKVVKEKVLKEKVVREKVIKEKVIKPVKIKPVLEKKIRETKQSKPKQVASNKKATKFVPISTLIVEAELLIIKTKPEKKKLSEAEKSAIRSNGQINRWKNHPIIKELPTLVVKQSLSDESRRNLSEAAKLRESNKVYSPETIEKMKNAKLGKKRCPMSDEHKKKISDSHLAREEEKRTGNNLSEKELEKIERKRERMRISRAKSRNSLDAE